MWPFKRRNVVAPRYRIRVDHYHYIFYRGGAKMIAYPKDLYTFSAACAAFEYWVVKVMGGDAGMDWLFPVRVRNIKLDNGDPDYIEVNA